MLLRECEEERKYMASRLNKLTKKIASLKTATPAKNRPDQTPSKSHGDPEAYSPRKTSNLLFDEPDLIELPAKYSEQSEGIGVRHILQNKFETILEKEEESQTLSPTKRSGVEANSYLFYGRDSPVISQFETASPNKPQRKSSARPEPGAPSKSLIASVRANSQLNKSSHAVAKHRDHTDKSFRISSSVQPAESPRKQTKEHEDVREFRIDYKILLPTRAKHSSSPLKSKPTDTFSAGTQRHNKLWAKAEGLDQLVYRRPESTLEEVKMVQAKRRNVEATVRRAVVREVKQTRDRQLIYRSKMQRIIRMNHLADYNDESHVNGMSLMPRF